MAGLSRSIAARSNTAAPDPCDLPRRGGPPGVLLLLRCCTLARLLFSFFLPALSSFLLFNVCAVQCSAVPSCVAPLHYRFCVHATMLVCSWRERSRRRIPPPPSFFYVVLLQAAQQCARTEHSCNAAPSVLELQRCTSSARLPYNYHCSIRFHKIKNLSPTAAPTDAMLYVRVDI